MQTKRCPRCKQTKSAEHFHTCKVKKDGLASMCKECRKVYSKEHYKANPACYHKAARKYGQKAVLFVAEYKNNAQCVRCGNDNVIVLEFHHRDPSVKSFAISEGLRRRYSHIKLKAEIDKCDVVCANCHKIIHHELRNVAG